MKYIIGSVLTVGMILLATGCSSSHSPPPHFQIGECYEIIKNDYRESWEGPITHVIERIEEIGVTKYRTTLFSTKYPGWHTNSYIRFEVQSIFTKVPCPKVKK